ncbi:MAG TPA: peptidoglycan-binding protein [Candidatus Limnocylindria bacterium]|nr:peptidoglycan-binding protein [Candidatus Limnocylindria bacterium]
MTPEEGLTPEELAAEEVTALPDKEVVSILDLNVNADLALDLAAPIDLAVAANANVAAPIDAAVGANVLSVGSSAQALADQGVMITQGIVGDSTATATQVSDLDQSNDVIDGGGAATNADATDGAAGETVTGIETGDALSGDVLDVNVDIAADADVAAPIAGAVAANANVAAPIDAAAAANIASVDSDAVAVANQDAIIDQSIEGDATATSDQDSQINQ